MGQDSQDSEDAPAPKEYFCGIGKFRPKFLQIFRNAKVFTFLLCCHSFVEGTLVSAFISLSLTSIETRYGLTAVEVSLFPSIIDIAVLISVIFVSYFAGKGHKPRWLAVSLLIQGTGALVFALPQFVFGDYQSGSVNGTRLESCNDGIDFGDNCEVTRQNRKALAFFYMGCILIGVGAASLFTVGLAYIDDIVHPKYVSIHLGVFFMWTVVGPALGFGIGGAFLSVYVDPWITTDLTPFDPTWVGAWWLNFLLSAVLAWTVSIFLFMFPKWLPDSHLLKIEREKEMAQKSTPGVDDAEASFLTKLKTLPVQLFKVIKTPSWIFITLVLSCTFFVVVGVTAFAPKFMEIEFSLSPIDASIAAGGIAIPTGVGGIAVGSLILYCTRSKGRTTTLINWIITFIAVPLLLVFLAHCPSPRIGGITEPFADGAIITSPFGPQVNSSCNMDCGCTSPNFEPICGADNVNYFSPCQAGCDKTFLDEEQQEAIFENCTCIMANLQLSNTTMYSNEQELLKNSTAVEGLCESNCISLGIFLGIGIVALFLIFIVQVPTVVITLRCVSEEQRSLALGAQSFVFRILGSIPGPIVYGVVFDSACKYFRFDIGCGTVGNCWVYDNFQLSWSVMLIIVIGMSLSGFFGILTWITYPNLREEEASEKQISASNAIELTGNEISQSEAKKNPNV